MLADWLLVVIILVLVAGRGAGWELSSVCRTAGVELEEGEEGEEGHLTLPLSSNSRLSLLGTPTTWLASKRNIGTQQLCIDIL